VFHAGKDIENRSWRNRHTIGTIAIHASGNADSIDALPTSVRRPEKEVLVRRAIIGVVDVVKVVEQSRSRWFIGPLGWVLKNPRRLRVLFAGLWKMPRPMERRVEAQLARPARTHRK
jgi:hypothetical protein